MSERVSEADYQRLIRELALAGDRLARLTFSGPRRGTAPAAWVRVVVRPVLLRGERLLQFSYFDQKQDVTKNATGDEAAARLDDVLAAGFKHIHAQSAEDELEVTVTSKGDAFVQSIHTTPSTSTDQPTPPPTLAHDRVKQAPLSASASADSPAAPFLRAVGVMTRDGQIKADMRPKFRQINEFLRLALQPGALERLRETARAENRPIRVVDCGCGNAYLTFAFYHYLREVEHIPTRMTGIDVNGPLLARHAEKTASLGWEGLTFEATPIASYHPAERPDVTLALHACDTATDDALAQATRWGSALVVCAPCCHHHLQAQLERQPAPAPFAPVERHAILKERLGDILTDAFRALLLRVMGYQTEVIEFVSSEHTAKNLMLRAARTLKPGDAKFLREYREMAAYWQVTPYLADLLRDELAALGV